MSTGSLHRLRAVVTIGGVQCLHTTYWSDSAVVGDTAAATEAAARVRAFWSSLAPLITGGGSLSIDPTTIILNSANGQAVGAGAGSPPATVTFTAAGDVVPLASQALLRYETGVYIAGRRFRGRTFIPGLTEASSAGTGPIAGTVSAINTAAGLLGTTVVSALTQAVWHRPSAPGASDGQWQAVTSRVCQPKWAVLKGRRP